MTEDNIDKAAKEAIVQIVEQNGADRAKVTEEYLGFLSEEKDKGVSNPQRRALRRLGLSYKGYARSNAEHMQGYVIGVTDAINTSRSPKNDAKDYVRNHGPDAAVERGLIKPVPDTQPTDGLAVLKVTADGQERTYAVLDTKENSPTHGEVLASEDFIRYAYGLAWRSPTDGPHLFSGVIAASNAGVKPEVPALGAPMSFDATWVGDSNINNTVRLRFKNDRPFVPDDSFGGPGLIDTLEKYAVPLDHADAKNYGRNDVVITYGTVNYMNLAPEGNNSRRLAVVDPFDFGGELSRTVWVPDHANIDFAEESDVYVACTISKSNNEYPDSLEAVGIIPHPEFTIRRPELDSMSDDDDDDSGNADSAAVEVVVADGDTEDAPPAESEGQQATEAVAAAGSESEWEW